MFPSHRLTRNYFQSRAVHSSLKNSHTTRIECARLYYTHYDQSFLILSKKLNSSFLVQVVPGLYSFN